jgi:chromosomal replication initiation ATPase DnaA
LESKIILPLFIQLEEDSGYFNFDLDEDDPDYDEKYEKYVEQILTPSMKPIIIYEKNQFVNNKLENKYRFRIQEELDKYNVNHKSNIEWKDILDVKKIESRYERE